jgi:hypothetical protein
MASYGCQWPYGYSGLCSSECMHTLTLTLLGLPPAVPDAQRESNQVPHLIIDLLAQGVLEFLVLCIRQTNQPATLCSCGGAPKRGGTNSFALIMPPWLSGGMCFLASE